MFFGDGVEVNGVFVVKFEFFKDGIEVKSVFVFCILEEIFDYLLVWVGRLYKRIDLCIGRKI